METSQIFLGNRYDYKERLLQGTLELCLEFLQICLEFLQILKTKNTNISKGPSINYVRT